MRFHRVTLKYRVTNWRRSATLLQANIEAFFQRHAAYKSNSDFIIFDVDCVSPERVTAYTLAFDHESHGVALESAEVKWIT